MKCCAIIFKSLNTLANNTNSSSGSSDNSTGNGSAGEGIGADDFLPIFIYIVLQSHCVRMHSNCEYIQTYLHPFRLMSKAGYCFVNLRSAMQFILDVEADVLNMPRNEFEEKLAENRRKYGIER